MNSIRSFIKIFAALLVLMNLVACDFINPSEETPSYIRIDTMILHSDTWHGTNSAKITDAWVYINDKSVGVYELPAEFPVLNWGECKVKIRPGIMLNGMAGTRTFYPFYQLIEKNIVLNENEAINDLLVLDVYYEDDVALPFEYQEDFESGGTIFEKQTNSDTNIFKVKDTAFAGQYVMPEFGGNYSGAIVLSDSADFCEIATLEYYALPKDYSPIFLEMNFKANHSFYVGYINTLGYKSFEFEVFPSDTWNKIYLNYTSFIGDNSYSNKFKICIRATKDTSEEDVIILLDNLKLIYFND